MDTHRLSRIEDKLDKLAEAVVSLARMEERMVTIFNRLGKYEEGLEKRIDEVEENNIKHGATLRFAERVFWVVITAAISTGFWYLR